MPSSIDARNGMLDHFGTQARWVSLHFDDPGLTGANEIVGAPYARQPITWNTAVGGRLDARSRQRFDLPAGAAIDWIGLWSSESGPTFLHGGDSADIVFVDAAGLVVSNIDVTVVDEIVVPRPSIPVGLSGAATNANTIRASWTTPTAGADDYEVQISLSPDPLTFEPTGVLTLTSPFDFFSLTPSTAYYIRVLAHNVSGYSDPSAVVGPVTTPAPPAVVPGDPSALVATGVSSTQNDLTWVAGSNATSHNISASITSATTGFATVQNAVAGTTFSHTNLCPSVQRWYRVRAKNDVGLSTNFSNVDDAITLAGAPPAVTDLALTPTQTSIRLDWTPTCSTTEYEIRRSNTGAAGSFTQIATTTGNTYLDSPLATGVTRHYRVRSVLISGVTRFTSADSNSVSATVLSSSASPCSTASIHLNPTQNIDTIINGASSPQDWCLDVNGDGSLTTYNVSSKVQPPDGSTIKGAAEPGLGTLSWQGNLPAGREPRFPETWKVRIKSPQGLANLFGGDSPGAQNSQGPAQDLIVENIWFDGLGGGIDGNAQIKGSTVFRRCCYSNFWSNGIVQVSGRWEDCVFFECGIANIPGPQGTGDAAAVKILTSYDWIGDHCYMYSCPRNLVWYDCHVGDESQLERVQSKVLNCYLDGSYPPHVDGKGNTVSNNLFAIMVEVCYGPFELAYNHMRDTGHFGLQIRGSRHADIHHNEFVNCRQNFAQPVGVFVNFDGRTPVLQEGEYRNATQDYCGSLCPSYDVTGVDIHHNTMNNHHIMIENAAITASTDPAGTADVRYYNNINLASLIRT